MTCLPIVLLLPFVHLAIGTALCPVLDRAYWRGMQPAFRREYRAWLVWAWPLFLGMLAVFLVCEGWKRTT